ncbi:LolA family protein [Ochrovirga pacifica]|uniref:LolA family protein n=1 Tax=Ochrovirga pacifica TaxID=1042376 RepID=UPI0002558AFC|nr:outer membrane lipoprotein carrier protein LolA [Ochrovirga pacifica]
MKKIIITVVCLGMQALTFGQNNPKAEAILNKVSSTLEKQQNISLEFSHTLENKMVDIKQTSKGSATIQGDKYVVHYLNNVILFDNKNTYIISPENEEVNITSVTENEDQSLTPSKMLSFYKKGYTYQLLNKNGNIQNIKLIPTEKSEEVSHIILGVDTVKNQITSLLEVGKNGTNTSFTITSYKTNQNLADNTFVFNRQKYIDLDYYINE